MNGLLDAFIDVYRGGDGRVRVVKVRVGKYSLHSSYSSTMSPWVQWVRVVREVREQRKYFKTSRLLWQRENTAYSRGGCFGLIDKELIFYFFCSQIFLLTFSGESSGFNSKSDKRTICRVNVLIFLSFCCCWVLFFRLCFDIKSRIMENQSGHFFCGLSGVFRFVSIFLVALAGINLMWSEWVY